MTECPECHAEVSGDLPFCGQCGARVSAALSQSAGASVASTGEELKPPAVTRVGTILSVDETPTDPKPDQKTPKPAAKKRTTGGHQPVIKQLDPGTLLNNRYEIARRIGGGGMGAVYLAKD